MRPYANKLKDLLENVSASVDASENVYARNTGGKNLLIIPISSNRGLAGAFNSNILKKTNQLINNDYVGYNITVLAIGKKVQDAFKHTAYNAHGTDLPAHTSELFDKLTFAKTSAAEKIMDAFLSKQFDRVILVYNQFKNAAVQLPTEEQLLPIVATTSQGSSTAKADYIFEPNQEEIINELIPRSVKTQFFKAILDSVASEHGARMTAMHKATDNAQAMQKELKITYNKARQASITKEILEIVGGAEALNG
jgi:F-type H+-transporting ATPase subunit gamma